MTILEYENHVTFDPIIKLNGRQQNKVAIINGIVCEKNFLIIDKIIYNKVRIISYRIADIRLKGI